MSQYYGTEAIILFSRDWGEGDRLITFYTKDLGRIDAIAKGVNRAKSKLRGHLNLFSRLRIMVTPGREYWRLLDAEQTPLDGVRYGLASKNEYARFLVRVLAESAKDNEVWQVLDRFEGLKTRSQLFFEKVRILKALGLMPDTGLMCAKTSRRIEEDDHEGFMPSAGEEGVLEKIIAQNI
ncbi:MAG: recombination protein O N-terminal domain-containing protein [bacterium]|nr:recombination protein O N-terminal domain-containing protein [bacterium]